MVGNKFCLLVKYETGECAFVTEKPDLRDALDEYINSLEQEQGEQCFKCYSLPEIKEVKLVKVFNGGNNKFRQ